jgi:hypothetical protein
MKLFKLCVINVQCIKHINTYFLELQYFDYDHVKPFKNSFFLQHCLESTFLYAQKMHFVFVT